MAKRSVGIIAMLSFFVTAILWTVGNSDARVLNFERQYQQAWCDARGGKTEVRLLDGTRADCVTDDHAIEFDFAKNWGEAVGQALHYGLRTNKKPGIVLILEKEKDERFLKILEGIVANVCPKITIWTMTPEDLNRLTSPGQN